MVDDAWLGLQEAALSSLDSDAREAALEQLCDAVESGLLDDRLVALGDRMLDALSVDLGEQAGDAVFGRSFSVLVLGACVARGVLSGTSADGLDATRREVEVAGPIDSALALSPQLLTAWAARFTRWFAEETDVRGYVAGRGWAHAVAHGADVWGEFARILWRIPEAHAVLLDALMARVMAPTGPWISGEADRLALAVGSVPGAAAEAVGRLSELLLAAQEGAVDTYGCANAEQLLRALALQAPPGSDVDRAVRRSVGERYPFLEVPSGALAASGLHHVEVWLAERGSIDRSWAWLLSQVGFTRDQVWDEGESWVAGGVYLTLTTSPNLSAAAHDRRRAGVNHLALRGGPADSVDSVMAEASQHGWRPLYAERYPHAGGSDHYAGWLENADGFKVEVVADPV